MFSLQPSLYQFYLATNSNILVYVLPLHVNEAMDGAQRTFQLDAIKILELPPIPAVPSGSHITFRAVR